MSSARSAILAALRASLGRGPVEPVTARALEQRLAASHGAPRPALEGDLLARFRAKAEKAAASVVEVAGPEAVPAAVAAYLKEGSWPTQLVCGEDSFLTALPWDASGLAVHTGSADADDRVSLARARTAVAETGSVVLLSGPVAPTRSNFLPEVQIVVVEHGAVVVHLEDAWTRLREAPLPRAVNFITGPSRTADIEQTLQLGAHGPRHLHLILVS